jgi:hypothetical protein
VSFAQMGAATRVAAALVVVALIWVVVWGLL